jgi:hypothetical protein
MAIAGMEMGTMEFKTRSPKSGYLGGMGSLAAIAALSFFTGVFPQVAAGQSSGQQNVSAKQPAVRKAGAERSGQQTFSSAADASQALVTALQNDDQPALLKILGSGAGDIVSSGDPTEDKSDREQFVQKYQQMHRLVKEPDGTTTLYIGAENWPTPIPLMRSASGWYFDTAAGKQEILYRRIGRNELAAIQVCQELIDAEKEYYGQPHDGGPDKQYAQQFLSDSGKHNGLYWKTESNDPNSPIGPLLAFAAVESNAQDSGQPPQPYMGYYFRVLKAQGPSAPGGARSYVMDGKMTGGVAFVAYPAEYRSSGVMTFIVKKDGIVYEKDLGVRTMEIAKSLAKYDRDSSWRKSD